MAVNVNTVYKTVLYILNKEQRGYITPDEFNNIATQVQLDIFNSYFPDADQANRKNQNNTQNDTEFFNSYINAENKLTPFITDEGTWSKAGITNGYQLWTYIGGRQVIKIGVVEATYDGVNGGSQTVSIADRMDRKEWAKIRGNKLVAPDEYNPIWVTGTGRSGGAVTDTSNPFIIIDPTPEEIYVNLIIKPKDPKWGFSIGAQGQYVYSAGFSTNFELIAEEQNKLVIEILKYCGVVIKDPQIVQIAAQQAQQEEINEKR